MSCCENNQYQPRGSEPDSSNPAMAARFRNITFNSSFVGTRQSRWPFASSFFESALMNAAAAEE